MIAVVLSSGGAKGAYQLGVWKALRRLKIKYQIVTGSSVGTLNGALMVQNDYHKAKLMWSNIDFNSIFKEEINSDFLTYKGKLKIFKMYLANIFLKGGMDVSKLEDTISKYINYEKFYNSKINFALVTVNLSTFKPIILEKKDIPKENLKDYLMASATCFPAFKIKNIDEDLFIDGAYYDSLPINQAIKMGATSIIAVDLNFIGIKKKVTNPKIPITYIRPRSRLDSFLYFHKDFTKRSIKLGFNDTMKIFKKLEGNKYTFKLNHLERNYKKNFKKYKKNIINMTNYRTNKKIISKILNKTIFSNIMDNNELKNKQSFNKTVEYLGEVFKIDETEIYNIKTYNKLLINKLNSYEEINLNLIEQKFKNKEINKLISRAYIIKYLYSKLKLIEDKKTKKELCNYALFLDKEILGAMYLYTIINRK